LVLILNYIIILYRVKLDSRFRGNDTSVPIITGPVLNLFQY